MTEDEKIEFKVLATRMEQALADVKEIDRARHRAEKRFLFAVAVGIAFAAVSGFTVTQAPKIAKDKAVSEVKDQMPKIVQTVLEQDSTGEILSGIEAEMRGANQRAHQVRLQIETSLSTVNRHVDSITNTRVGDPYHPFYSDLVAWGIVDSTGTKKEGTTTWSVHRVEEGVYSIGLLMPSDRCVPCPIATCLDRVGTCNISRVSNDSFKIDVRNMDGVRIDSDFTILIIPIDSTIDRREDLHPVLPIQPPK